MCLRLKDQILVALMVLANSKGLRWDWDSGREKENTSPIEETAQTVVPPEVTFVIIFGAYIWRGRKTEESDTPEELSAKRSNGKLLLEIGSRGVIPDSKASSVGKDLDDFAFEETDCCVVDRGYHFYWR
jgi:hypothetical protein